MLHEEDSGIYFIMFDFFFIFFTLGPSMRIIFFGVFFFSLIFFGCFVWNSKSIKDSGIYFIMFDFFLYFLLWDQA